MANKLKTELDRSNRVLRALSECNQLLIHSEDEVDLLNKICKVIVNIGGYKLCWAGLAMDNTQKPIQMVAQFGIDEYILKNLDFNLENTIQATDPIKNTIQMKQPVICQNITTDPNFISCRPQAIKLGYGSFIALPLKDKNLSFGILNIYASEPYAFNHDERKFLTELANDLAYGIISLRSRKTRIETEEKLHKEWENIFQAIGHPTTILSPDQTILAVNRAAIEATGFTSTELVGKKCYEIFHNDSKAPWCCPLKKLSHSRGVETETMEIHTLNGYFFVSCTPIFDDHNNLQKIIHIATDISERIQVEQALTQSEATLSSIFRAAPVGIGLVSDRILKKVNDRILDMTGYTREELLGKSSRILYPSEEEYQYVGEEKYKQIRAKGTGTVETIWKQKNGKLINVLLSSTPLKQQDWFKDVTFTAMDITEQKRGEIETRQRNRELTALNNMAKRVSASLSVKQVGKEALLAASNSVSPDLAILFLLEEDTLYPIACYPPNSNYCTNQIQNHRVGECLCGIAIKNEKPVFSIDINNDQRCTWTDCKNNGFHSFSALPLRSGERQIGVLGLASSTQRDFSLQAPFLETLANEIAIGLQNALYYEEAQQYAEELEKHVTQRTAELQDKTKQLESANLQLKRADQLKSVFLASMSHELRTPLNSIIGFTGILLMELAGNLNLEQKKQLNLVKNSANHLLDLINDILDISKIEAGKVEITPETFLLKDLIKEVIDLFSTQISAKGLTFITNNPIDITLFNDKRRVKQILFNLISNAVKFTDQGSITIFTELQSSKKLKIRVIDTGIGIKKSARDKLFNPFQQIDDSLTKHFEGTGLGLYLCKSLVTILGGTISAKSKYGKGSEFTFTLPLTFKEGRKK